MKDLKEQFEAERKLPPRALTTTEASLIRWLLEHSSEDACSFLPQLDGMKAVRSCICGCPSVKLVVKESIQSGIAREERVLCDMVGQTLAGELVGVLLFQDQGKLVELEAYSVDGEIKSETQEFEFPTLESLKKIEWLNNHANNL